MAGRGGTSGLKSGKPWKGENRQGGKYLDPSPKKGPRAVPEAGARIRQSSRQIWILKKKCTANVSSQIKRKKHGQLLIKYRTSCPGGGAHGFRAARCRGLCAADGDAGGPKTHRTAQGQHGLERSGKTPGPNRCHLCRSAPDRGSARTRDGTWSC